MKFILPFLLICFKLHAGQCPTAAVYVFPDGPNITQNNVFLIAYREVNYHFRNSFNNFKFYAVNQKNEKWKLEIVDTSFGFNYGQILLKPYRKFKIGDTMSIRIYLKDTMQKPTYFNSFLNYLQASLNIYSTRSWVVTVRKDIIPPVWLSDSVAIHVRVSNSSAPGMELSLKIPVSDNNDSTLTFRENNPHLYKMMLGSTKFYYSSVNQSIYSWSGFCEGDIHFTQNDEYKAKISIMDQSGNLNKQTRLLDFKVETGTAKFKK